METIKRLSTRIKSFLLFVFIVIFGVVFFIIYGLYTNLFVADTAMFILALGTLFVSILSFFLICVNLWKRNQWMPSLIEGSMLWFVLFLLIFLFLNKFCIIAYLLFLGTMICIIGGVLSPFTSAFDGREKIEPSSKGFAFNGYTLYCKDICLKGSRKKQRIYYFSKKKPKDGIPCEKPDTYIVGVNKQTGLPYLKRKTKM